MNHRTNHRILFSAILVLAAISTVPCLAAHYYVATNGNDTYAGTNTNAPWRTVQKAANTLVPGDVAFVRGGIYNELVTITVSGNAAAGRVLFQNFPGELPVIDGTGLAVPSANNGLFLLEDRAFVTIQGFELRNYTANSSSKVPAGIYITGASHDLSILANHIHHIANTNKNGAFGLAVYGTSPTQPISNLLVHGNELDHLQTGWSESLVLNGNVSGFEVSSNLVHDNNNIGIDFIGYEGTCPDANQDRARNGACCDNRVWNITSFGNPAYGTDYSADGIYCDGSTEIVIERNQVWAVDIGVELASEHAGRTASDLIVRDNLISSNHTGGIFIGGYDTKRGRTENCRITHNTLYKNDTRLNGNGEFYLQFDTRSNLFTHNLLVANSQNLLIGNPFNQNSNNIVDWNLYFAPGGTAATQWQWKKISYTGFSAYQSATANDTHSVFADPRLLDANNMNFHLATNSPAINAGDPAFLPAPRETDIDAQPRSSGGRVDIGADEFGGIISTLGIGLLGTNRLTLQMAGEPGHRFVWEQAATPSGNWQPVQTNWATNGAAEMFPASTSNSGFFRTRRVE